ncbi:MAG: CoA ester lyase [Chloroflexi bacterium]|nr:CoA ester lyase [Chloroflexota bacterium]
MELLRSLLFVPGNRADMLQKAGNAPADVLVPDLEDSVPAAEKVRARETVARALPTLAAQGQRVMPRANSLGSGLLAGDLAAVVSPHIFAVTVGKVSSAWEAREAAAQVAAAERRAGLQAGSIKLVPWLETAGGVLHAYDISTASPRVIAVAFGADDYLADMGIGRSPEDPEIAFARHTVALAARAAGVLALDTPHVHFRDPEGLKADIAKARAAGYRGKFAIHPGQLETINTLFAPSPQEVEYARRVVQASAEAEAQGRGVTSVDGRMVDAPIIKRARDVLAAADAIAALQKRA